MHLRLHRAWAVLAGLILIQAGMLGIMINCTGILFSAVLADLGFRAGDLSLYYAIRSLVSAATVGFTSRLFFRCRARWVMAGLGLLMSGSFAAMSCFSSLWQWYLAAVAAGISMGCIMVVLPIVINNWFRVHNGLLIGLALASSGIAAAVFSPICSAMASAWGWRAAAASTGLIGGLLVVLPSLTLLEPAPEAVGCTPLGVAAARTREAPHPALAPPGWVFWACAVTLLGTGCLNQFNNQLPTFALSIGYPLATGALVTSCSMLGNVLGKFGLGALADRIGAYRAARLVLCLVLGVMLLFLFAAQLPLVFCLAAFGYGTVYSLATTMPSLLLLDLYGPGGYKPQVSRMQAANGVTMAAASAVFPYLYDLTGSFRPVFWLGIGLCALSLALLARLQRYSRQNAPASSQREEPVPPIISKTGGIVS